MLQLEGDVYLPPLPQANHQNVSGVITEDVKVFYLLNFFRISKNSALRVIQVPHLPNFMANDIIAFARKKVQIDSYLPKFKCESKVPDRSWLCNLS